MIEEEAILTKEEAIKIAVKTTAEYLKKEREKEAKERRDKRLRNTRLLMENYITLHGHCDKAVCNLRKAVEEETGGAVDLLEAIERCDGDKFIQSLKNSVTLTRVIMNHVDEMIRVYRGYCETSGRLENLRQYRILEYRYFKKMRIQEICDKEHIDRSTVYRDNSDSIRVLSSLIFGIGGLI